MSRPNGCNGSCCERFPIGGYESDSSLQKKLNSTNEHEEYIKIRTMLVLLQDGSPPHYTCKHFDTETRLCNDYENRPDMCRLYPSYNPGDPCKHCWLTTEQLTGRLLV